MFCLFNKVPGQGISHWNLVAVFHLAKIEGSLLFWKPEGSPGEGGCQAPLLPLPVLADVDQCAGASQHVRRGRAEGDIPVLGFSAFRVYHGGQGAISPRVPFHSSWLQKIVL